jgi:diguanylate cyclase (GGDEF)-like protein
VVFTALLALAVLLQIGIFTGGYIVFVQLRFTIAALLYRATTDKLTGVPNREAADNRIKARLTDGTHLSVAFVDIVDFKAINDTHGHAAGDAALRYVADRLNQAVQPHNHMVARYSGDEFLIIVEGGGYGFAATIARTALRYMSEIPFVYFAETIPVEISIGVAVADDTNDPDELIRRADHAMFHAKHSDGPNPAVWMPGMTMPEPSTTGRRSFRDAAPR